MSLRFVWLAALLAVLHGCIPNNPYRSEEAGRNYLYSSFAEPPKHLDPAVSYSSGEYAILMQIYESPLQYHYLKRPYELVPLTATEVPEPTYYADDGEILSGDPPPEKVARAVYRVRLKPSIHYQPHPCFAGREDSRPAYYPLDERQVEGIEDIEGFPLKDTRELTAADYVYQIKRLAHPRLSAPSPIFSTMAKYIEGLDELGQELAGALARIRAERRKARGVLYNQESDEREDPIWLDLDRFDLRGVRIVDRYTYEIVLKQKYPQFVYWLAMPFFAPVPREADRFFAQAPLVRRNLNLDNRPVGTGPYRMATFRPHQEIVLVRNENFHPAHYPTAGESEDRPRGLLDDAGKQLPFIEKAIYKLEKEAIPRWNKFLQGYYETSGIATEVFDQVVQMNTEGGLELSDELRTRGVRLLKAVDPTTVYLAFNMLDDEVGGYSEDRQKLRQALSIAMGIEEWIQIFLNGRGVPAQDLLPPGIFGHHQGREGLNRFVYDWDEALDRPVRKPIERARELLAEAGYAGGRDRDGQPLVLYFDTYWTGAAAKARLDWLRKQFGQLDIDLQFRQTDYNRFQDKVRQGNFQILLWGWHADYPDPENFLFLLYGPNSKARFGGENVSNYDNPAFNRLFRQVESMQNGPERLELLAQIMAIVRRDAPWIWGFHPVSFGLYHEWYANAKPMTIGKNTLKYKKLDAELREGRRRAWNQPIWWPVALVLLLLIAGAIPAVFTIRKREKEVEIA